MLGLLSWMEKHHPGEYADLMGDFGLRAEKEWKADGGDLLNGRNGIWESFFSRESATGLRDTRVEQRVDAAVLQNWQWTARFTMLPFASPAYREANWHLARLRLQKICELSIGGHFATAWRIGNVFTSERLTAKLLRLHVRESGKLSTLPTPGQPPISAAWIQKLLAKTLTPAEVASGPSKWGDAVQHRLESAVDKAFARYVKTTVDRNGNPVLGDFTRIQSWTSSGRALSDTANSFKLLSGDM